MRTMAMYAQHTHSTQVNAATRLICIFSVWNRVGPNAVIYTLEEHVLEVLAILLRFYAPETLDSLPCVCVADRIQG
jgi:hypothetical protein